MNRSRARRLHGLIRIPADLAAVTTAGDEAHPDISGVPAAAIDEIWDAAQGLYRTGAHPAIQVCVRHGGIPILDRAIGHARGNGPRDPSGAAKQLATPETPFVAYSASKGVTAFVVHMLHERGELDIHRPVCHYIPGYERNGKGSITIAQVLSHRAGVASFPRQGMPDLVTDEDFVRSAICNATPINTSGRSGYHAISAGFILGEVVRAATGRDIRSTLADEILNPLGFRWTNYGVAPKDVPTVALDYLTGPRHSPIAAGYSKALGLPLEDLVEMANRQEFLTSVVPAANVVTTAVELSRFFEIFRRGGELDGVRIVSPGAIRNALSEPSRVQIDRRLLLPLHFSYGLMLGSRLVSPFGAGTEGAFGHTGFTQIIAWADPRRELSCALLTSGKPVAYPGILRFQRLIGKINELAGASVLH